MDARLNLRLKYSTRWNSSQLAKSLVAHALVRATSALMPALGRADFSLSIAGFSPATPLVAAMLLCGAGGIACRSWLVQTPDRFGNPRGDLQEPVSG